MTIGVGYGIAAWWRDGHTEDVHRALDELALAGFDGVELFGPGLRPFIDRPVQFRRLLDLHGLTLTSVCSSFAYLDPSRRGYEDEDFRRNVAFAAEAGSKWALLDGGHKPHLHRVEDVTENDVQGVADAANRYARIAQEHGLSLAWH